MRVNINNTFYEKELDCPKQIMIRVVLFYIIVIALVSALIGSIWIVIAASTLISCNMTHSAVSGKLNHTLVGD